MKSYHGNKSEKGEGRKGKRKEIMEKLKRI